MADPRCGATHPWDEPPIQRRCNRQPGHEPPHRMTSHHIGSQPWTDEWHDEGDAA